MKRLFVIFILSLCFPVQVFASNTEKHYKFYYLEKEYSEKFYKEGENDDEYPNKGKLWIYSDDVKTSFDKPKYEEDIIEEVNVIEYQEQKKVRYIILDQIYSNSKINLEEIEVFNKDEKIEYRITCGTCTSEFFTKIQNTLVAYELNYIDNGTKIIVDLQDEYYPNDLRISLHIAGATGKTGKIRLTINNTNDINDKYYSYTLNTTLGFYKEEKIYLENIEHEERLDDEIKTIEASSIDNAKVLSEKTKYLYKTRLYQYYKENKHYLDGYYKDLPGLLRDDANFMEVEIKKDEPLKVIEYVEKEVEVPVVTTEEVEVEVPVIEEKIVYQTKTVEMPVEYETVVEKEKVVTEEVQPKENYILKYTLYLSAILVFRKMSLFKA